MISYTHFFSTAPADCADELRQAGATVGAEGRWPDGTPVGIVAVVWEGAARFDRSVLLAPADPFNLRASAETPR